MILVTGATGILGRVILLNLLKSGRTVRATYRDKAKLAGVEHSFSFYDPTAANLFDQIQWVPVDFNDIQALEALLIGVTEVYHCAAKVSFNPDDRQEMYRLNIEGTRNLLYACESSSVKKFCYVSSIAVLDGADETGKVTENSGYNPKMPHSSYAKSKHFSEMEVWRASAEGLRTVIINPGVIIGSGNWESSSGEIFSTFEKHAYSMSGSSNYVDVRDVAEIAVRLMDGNVFGERFILVSEDKKISEVGDFIRKKLGKSPTKIIPRNFLLAGNMLNNLLGWLIPPLRMLTKVNIEAVTSHHAVSNQKIRERLNYTFIPVFDSLTFHLNNYISDKNRSVQPK